MCLLPLPNTNFSGVAYKKGILEFDCGACPECLRKRSNVWVLRSVFEARSHANNCMVTLTYDNFIRDKSGRIVGETPVNPDLHVSVRDIQLFIKRLRKYCSSVSDEKIKYIACAEYGNRTHRAHYHLILFGVKFPDLCYHKKSKRGNPIFLSPTLWRLWGHGICTVDSIHIYSAVARYCTKYCAKSRSDDTFMTCSQKIGFDNLYRAFNGKSYIVDGREYPIPRFIWQHYISQKYKGNGFFTYKYLNKSYDSDGFCTNLAEFDFNRCLRRRYYDIRDNDPVYLGYLSYWRNLGSLFETLRVPVRQRILQLPESKFHFYKVAALECYDKRRQYHVPYIAPGSSCITAYHRYFHKFRLWCTCPIPSCPNRASDTVRTPTYVTNSFDFFGKRNILYGLPFCDDVFVQFAQQLAIDI